MELPFTPDRPNRDRPEPRRDRPMRAPSFSSRDAKDMVSLLISAVAGALATGALSTLIIMSSSAFAETESRGEAANLASEVNDLPERLFPARAAFGDDLPLTPFQGPRVPELPPVCTCILPQHIQN